MIIPYHIQVTIVVIAYLCIFSRSCASSPCPLDLDYVLKLPWDSSSCHNAVTSDPSSNCCQTLTGLYGVAFAQYLKQTSQFRLPDHRTSISCLSDFQTKLSRLGLHQSLASACFRSQQFVNTTNTCADVRTRQDWLKILGKSTSLDEGCRHDLTELSACDACVIAGFRVQSRLLARDGNDSHSKGCFHYTILYAAGVVNEFGPQSTGALSCIFGLPLIMKRGGGDRNLIFVSIGAGFAAVLVVICLFGFWLSCGYEWREKQSQRVASESGGFPSSESDDDRPLLNWRPKADSLWYSLGYIERVTENFSSKNLIGKGQFGVVYKGKIADGSLIAVKEVVNTEFQGDAEFLSEVEIISSLKHRNLVPIRGCCVDSSSSSSLEESKKYLIYDYMPNGNLGDHLFPKQRGGNWPMSWPQRKSVILDVANALVYLHHGVKPPVYHRDIKPTNILLDSCMRARLADFGLAKRGKEGESHLTTRIAGTHGYLAPEYALYGQLTGKSDVYSFGIVVLEIMCGRKALDMSSSTFLITDWAWPLVKAGKIEQVLDPCLLNTRYPRMIMERFVIVGILCAHLMVALRPTSLDALKMLEGDIEVPTIPDRPFYTHFSTGVVHQ
ncbi:Protein kinase superfamily protein [Perilla frutescens var. hirtella]|uniref:non-specific serine/threonine protein kinase n=1 Tax=Perilla frutescens var. hirtella TaxID=608512 RepID=A0AAD4P252_PERFH|nr:Protein kinase superfamily protein [Perilla frutescens var. hirtella]